MSGLHLATKSDEPAGPGPASPPPLVPPPPQAESDPGASSSAFTLPAPGAPPPPPLPAANPGPGHQAARSAAKTSGSNWVWVSAIIVLVLAVLIGGSWYLAKKTDLFAGSASPSPTGDQPAPKVTRFRPVKWPAIQLTGLAGAGDAGSAILNGELIALNQRIEGATLVDISGDGVILEMQNDRKFIRIGESTD